MTDPVLAMLLEAVVAEPGSDLPRLAYADRCLELGDDDRADFIHVQVELARLRPGPTAEDRRKASNLLARHRKGAPVRMTARTPATLLLRESLLWGANYLRWAVIPGPWTAHGSSRDECQAFMSAPDNSSACRLWLRRGFPCAIRLVSGDWLGGGTGRQGWGWGRALVRAAPLEAVTFGDRQPSTHPPASVPQLWSWYGGVGGGHPAYRLRWDLFKHLPGWTDQDRMDYASREEAERALSSAALAWARAAAPEATAP